MLQTRVFLKASLVFFALAGFVLVAHANDENQKAFAIAKQNACLGCHAIDKKIVGPSFQSVAQKYKNDPNAQAFLKNKILQGGAGSWGVVPMPANAKLNASDLSLLTNWILRGAPQQN